jgi:hypothetical protein
MAVAAAADQASSRTGSRRRGRADVSRVTRMCGELAASCVLRAFAWREAGRVQAARLSSHESNVEEEDGVSR